MVSRSARSGGRRALACLALVCAVPAQAFPLCGSAMCGRAMNLLGAQQPARVCHGARSPAGRRGLAAHSVVAQLKLPSQIDWEDRGGGGGGAGGGGAGGGGGPGGGGGGGGGARGGGGRAPGAGGGPVGGGGGGHGERGDGAGRRGDRERGEVARLRGAERRYNRIQRSNAPSVPRRCMPACMHALKRRVCWLVYGVGFMV